MQQEQRQSPTYRSLSRPIRTLGFTRPIFFALLAILCVAWIELSGWRLAAVVAPCVVVGRIASEFDFRVLPLLIDAFLSPPLHDPARRAR